MFQLQRGLGNKLGCPVTRIDYLPSPVDPVPISSEIHFLRNNLSEKENKVFKAWERNMKKYPITK